MPRTEPELIEFESRKNMIAKAVVKADSSSDALSYFKGRFNRIGTLIAQDGSHWLLQEKDYKNVNNSPKNRITKKQRT